MSAAVPQDDSKIDTDDATSGKLRAVPRLTNYESFNPGDHSGQLRLAHYMARYYGNRLLHAQDAEGWYYWDGKRWRADNVNETNRIAQATLKRAYAESFDIGDADEAKRLRSDIAKCHGSASGIAGMIRQAAAELDFVTTLDALDADPFLLNVANGTLDLHTGELRPHDPADRITKVTRAAYHPDAVGGLWETVLERVLPDPDVREYLQRLIGMSLIGEVREHILPILRGPGRNGKNTVYEAIVAALGDYAGTADPDLLISQRDTPHPTNQMDLRGKRIAIMSEIGEGSRMNTSLMKRLTGDTYIKARRMRQDFDAEFRASHTSIMVTNHLPDMSGDDSAAWSRVRVIPFDVVIPDAEQDVDIPHKLQLEADAILGWAMRGLRSYLAGGLQTPEAVKVKTNSYRLDNDEIGRFIAEMCVTGPAATGDEATTRELYNAFAIWRTEQTATARVALGERVFGGALDKRGHTSLPPVKGRRGRKGLALSTEAKGGSAG